MVIGNNGIISKAIEAKNATLADQENTQIAMNNLYSELESVLGETTGGGSNEGDEGENTTPEGTVPKTETYVGYYADFEGDGTVEGIIYADLAVGKSSSWNGNSDSSYSYEAQTGLKDYYVSKTGYSGAFGTKDVLSPTGTGNDRFYVMALSNFETSSYTSFYWYYTAYSNASLDRIVSKTYNDFGEGKANTVQMIADWNSCYYGDQNAQDLWGAIQNNGSYDIVTSVSDSCKWFIPSKAEWAAFGDCLYTNEDITITTSNYEDYGIKNYYWSSSQSYSYTAYGAGFGLGYIYSYSVHYLQYVRLSATF